MGELTQIRSIQNAIGGCVPNVAIDLKKIAPELTIRAVGSIGDDPEGAFVTKTLSDAGLDISGLGVKAGEKTSFTDVMSIPGGQRTFFTFPGASADFGVTDVNFASVNARIFHLGYFLLLQKVDDGDGLKILQKALEYGMETSIDLVSENSDRYGLVLPCLPYTDYLIINELEAGKLAEMGKVVLVTSTKTYKPGTDEVTDGNAKILCRNEALGRLAEKYGCTIDDLYTVSAGLSMDGYSKDGTHFSDEGYTALSEAVAASIKAVL